MFELILNFHHLSNNKIIPAYCISLIFSVCFWYVSVLSARFEVFWPAGVFVLSARLHPHYFIPDIHVHAPWCVSAKSAFAVLAGCTAKSQTEENYKTYLCHTAFGRAIWLLVYLLWCTPSHWESATPPPPPPPHSCWLPARCPLSPRRLTPVWMPVAASHGGCNSHTRVSVCFCFFVPTTTHCCQRWTQ